MLAVVLVSLAGSVDEEARALAADLGVTAYDARLVVRGALPAVVLRTGDREHALGVLGKLRARGNEAVAFDEAAVARGDRMLEVRGFRIEHDALVAPIGGREERIVFDDILAIVRAVSVVSTTSTETTRERKVSVGRALLSGGLVATKSVERTSTTTAETRDFVAYVFRRSGAPCVLAATRLRYDALPAARPSQIENFGLLLQILRGRASAAAYDERLTSAKPGADVELLAHAVALASTRAR